MNVTPQHLKAIVDMKKERSAPPYGITMHRTRRPISPVTLLLIGINIGAWGFVLVRAFLR